MKRIFIFTGFFILYLSACGGPSSGRDVDTPAKLQVLVSSTFSPAADEVLRNLILAWGDEQEVEIELIESMPSSPAQMQDGRTFPDCGTVWNLNEWIVNDVLVETTELVSDLNENSGGYLASALRPSLLQGKQWAVPVALVNSVFFVREDKITEAGMPLPQTWDDVRIAAEAITIPDKFWGWGMQIGASGDTETAFRTKLWSFGGSVWDEEGKPALDSPQTRQVLDFVEAVWLSGVVPPDAPGWDDGSNNDAYMRGDVGMVLNAGSLLNRLQREDPSLLARTALLPAPAGLGGRFSPGNITHWAIFKGGGHEDLCMRLTRWLFAPGQIQSYYEAGGGNFLPVYQMLLNDPMWQDPYRKVLADLAPHTVDAGYPGPLTPWAIEARSNAVVGKMVRRVLLEEWSNDAAITEANTALWQIYEEWQERRQ